MLSNLEEQGYKIVPISKLIMKKNYHMDATGKQIADDAEKQKTTEAVIHWVVYFPAFWLLKSTDIRISLCETFLFYIKTCWKNQTGHIKDKGRKISQWIRKVGHIDRRVTKMSCCGSGMGSYRQNEWQKKSFWNSQMGHIDVKVVKMSYYDIYMGHNKYFFSYMSWLTRKWGHNIKIFLYMSKFFTEFVFQKPEKGLWVENIRAQ